MPINKNEFDCFDGYVDALEDAVTELEGNTEALHGILEAKDRRIEELERQKADIIEAVKRTDIGYIESVYLGYDDDGNPPEPKP